MGVHFLLSPGPGFRAEAILPREETVPMAFQLGFQTAYPEAGGRTVQRVHAHTDTHRCAHTHSEHT